MIAFGPIVAKLLPALNATAAGDLVFWTEAELYEFADELAQAVSRFGIFVERSEIAVTSGSAAYSLPVRFAALFHLSLNNTSLSAAGVDELEALDSSWPTAAGTVSRYVLDVVGLSTVTLYKIPGAPGTLTLLVSTYPAIANSSAIARAASPVGDYWKYGILKAARSKEGEGMMPDVAAHCRERMSLYEALFERYWGRNE